MILLTQKEDYTVESLRSFFKKNNEDDGRQFVNFDYGFAKRVVYRLKEEGFTNHQSVLALFRERWCLLLPDYQHSATSYIASLNQCLKLEMRLRSTRKQA